MTINFFVPCHGTLPWHCTERGVSSSSLSQQKSSEEMQEEYKEGDEEIEKELQEDEGVGSASSSSSSSASAGDIIWVSPQSLQLKADVWTHTVTAQCHAKNESHGTRGTATCDRSPIQNSCYVNSRQFCQPWAKKLSVDASEDWRYSFNNSISGCFIIRPLTKFMALFLVKILLKWSLAVKLSTAINICVRVFFLLKAKIKKKFFILGLLGECLMFIEARCLGREIAFVSSMNKRKVFEKKTLRKQKLKPEKPHGFDTAKF